MENKIKINDEDIILPDGFEAEVDDDIEIYQISLQIEPTSLISSMDIPQFEEWLKRDTYGNVQEVPNKENLQEVLKFLQPHPHLLEYEQVVLRMLIES